MTPGAGPTSSANQTTQAAHDQNARNNQGGGGRGKKQKGGMSDVAICGGSTFLNSPDGFGYIAPPGCLQVPVVPYGQDLATASVHISATGQANAQFDNRY
jgi:hypothetical protein